MSIADELRQSVTAYQRGDAERAKLDNIVERIVKQTVWKCRTVAEKGGRKVEGFLKHDSNSGYDYFVDASACSMYYGPPEERHASQKAARRRASCPNILPKVEKERRQGFFSSLDYRSAKYVVDSVSAELTSQGLDAHCYLVLFHDMEVTTSSWLGFFPTESYRELPTTYPNLLISVSW